MGNRSHVLEHEVHSAAAQLVTYDPGVGSIRLQIAAADDPKLRQILEEYLSSWFQNTTTLPA